MKKNKSTNIKEYLKNIFCLECTIYKLDVIIKEYLEFRKNSGIKEPTKKSLPIKPQKLKDNRAITLSSVIGWVIVIVSKALNWQGVSALFFLASSVVTSILIYRIYTIGSLTGFIDSLKPFDEAEYSNKIQKYNDEVSQIEKEFSSDKMKYEKEKAEYNTVTSEQLEVFNKIKRNLQKNLDKLYSFEIIYPKYRNRESVSAFYEYIESGRCEDLKGYEGAYNIYENEVRMGFVSNYDLKLKTDGITEEALRMIVKNRFQTFYDEADTTIKSANDLICEQDN